MTTVNSPGLLVVMIDIDPAYEEEFNDWYAREHLPERVGLPGFRSCRRFRWHEGDGARYLAVYELDSVEALHTPEYEALLTPSAWTSRISARFTSRIRGVYTEIGPDGHEWQPS